MQCCHDAPVKALIKTEDRLSRRASLSTSALAFSVLGCLEPGCVQTCFLVVVRSGSALVARLPDLVVGLFLCTMAFVSFSRATPFAGNWSLEEKGQHMFFAMIMVPLVVPVMSARCARHLVTRLLQLFGCRSIHLSCWSLSHVLSRKALRFCLPVTHDDRDWIRFVQERLLRCPGLGAPLLYG